MFAALLGILTYLQVAPPTQKEIDAAIDRGKNWLLAQVRAGLPGDTAINAGMGLNYDALVMYTLLHCGMDRKDEVFRGLVERVANQKITRTYTAACVALALNEQDPIRYRSKICECAQFLVDNQCKNGQWDYGKAYPIPKGEFGNDSGSTRTRVRIKPSGRPQRPHGDNSNSQYAALGLYACWRAGFDFERGFLTRALQWWEGSQHGDGSWNYCDQGKNDVSVPGFGAMTAGGGASIIMLRKVRGGSGASFTARRAISWFAANFSVSEHPKAPENRRRFHYYYLYALERLGDLSRHRKMGRHDWYGEGAAWLLQQQKGGMWEGVAQPGRAIPATCFALLFLERSMMVRTGGKK